MSRLAIGKRYPVLLLLIIAISAMISWPLWQAGYYSDDMVNSLIPGRMGLYQQSFANFILVEMQNALNNGRMYPLSVLSSVSIFYFFNHLAEYQIIHSLFIWLSVLSFCVLIKKITRSNSAALLFIIVVPLCWSVRDAADPLTSYAILLPLVMLFIIFTQLCYLQYQNTGREVWLALSLLMFMGGLCTYEVGVVAFTLLLTLQYCGSQQSLRTHLKNILPFFILLTAYLILIFFLHFISKNVYDGIQIAFSIRFYHAFLFQLSAAFPFSYQIFANGQFPSWGSFISVWQMSLEVTALLAFYLLLTTLRISKKNCVDLILIALNLIIIPALLIAISLRYQKIISPGVGYIPIFIQYFGVGCLLLALLGWLTSLPQENVSRTLLNLCLALLLSTALSVVTAANYQTINQLNQKLSFKRSLTESALQHQLLAKLPHEATLIEKKYLWNGLEFYWLNANKKIAELRDVYDPSLLTAILDNKATNKYLLTSWNYPGTGSGYALFGPVVRIQAKPVHNTVITQTIYVDSPEVFISAQNQREFDLILASLSIYLNLSAAATQDVSTAYKNHHQAWVIITLPAGPYPIFLTSLLT